MNGEPGKIKKLIFTPEMRIFWVSVPFLAVAAGLGFVKLPLALAFLELVLLAAVAGLSFWNSLRLGATNSDARLEKDELRSILAGLQDALLAYDGNFRITFFNPAAESLFGLKASWVLGKPVHPGDAEKPELRLLVQVLYPSLAPTFVLRSRTGEYPQVADVNFDSPILNLRVITSPVADEKGQLQGFVKMVRDRTREISLIKSKNEFVTVASHQLRTPITEVNWALQTINEDQSLSEGNKEIAGNALRSAKKLQTIVEDLLNVSRIEEGRFGYNFGSGDLVDYLDKILAEAMPQVQRAGLKLYFDRPQGALPQVQFDPQKLSMVLSNLMDNAIRYNVPNGQITVGAHQMPDGPYVEVSVKDTGIGVPADQVEKLFNKFFRADNAVKSQTEGTGMGLYIAKNIIQAHGGRMWAESVLDRGTTFHFTLPTDPSLVPTQEVALE